MNAKHLAVFTLAISMMAWAAAQDPTPAETPRFTGGSVTGDAANGGPVGGGISNNDIRASGYNTGGTTGGSTAVIETPTPTPRPSASPSQTPPAGR